MQIISNCLQKVIRKFIIPQVLESKANSLDFFLFAV